jgi:hypothetical protein
MSKHQFTLRVEVDHEALRTMNSDRASERRHTIDDEPSEWGMDELLEALTEEVATGEVIDYETTR